MKKLLTLVLVGMMALSITACAKQAGGEKAKVKCPACGYEFQIPNTPGN